MTYSVKDTIIILIALLFSVYGYSQIKISGTITDKTGNTLPGATVKILNKDSVFINGTASDTAAKFNLTLEPGNKYILLFSYIGYRDRYKSIETGNEPLLLGKIVLRDDTKTLSEVEVKTVQQRGEQKGDTTAFKADAFKTHPDATAEDLLKKMPGVTSDNNGLKINGENVQKVLVDGKPFFGDDPNATIKNIPAEIIDKVEVFDKMSDQSAFTGFNDGNQQKTINFVTKKGKNIGQFGRVYAGGGADEKMNGRYNAGASINSFNVKRRISLLLLSNNINQQNFSTSDITGAMGNSGQSQGGGNNSGGSGPGGGGSSSLLTSPQNGITATQSAGLNYSDSWGRKINVSGSYFFNYSDNTNHSDIVRDYFTSNKLVYSQTNDNKTTNTNHRGNLRFEYNIDSINKLIITPSFNFQDNHLNSSLAGSNVIADNVPLSNTQTNQKIGNNGYDFSNSILYQHKYKKEGRTVSVNLSTQLTEKNNDGNYNSLNVYTDTTSGLNQLFTTNSNSKKASVNLSYTEPLNKNAQVQINYNPSYTEGLSNKVINDFNAVTNGYSDFNTPLSNKYNNTYQTQRGGLGYKYRKDKLNFSFGADAQQSMLNGSQIFPVAFGINQSFQNILPNAQLNYRFSKSKNLRIYYRTGTNIPNVSQLQSVLDISNPLQVKTGNINLKQTFDNNLTFRFGGFNPATSRNAMLFVNAGYSDNYVTNATTILRSDSTLQGYTIKRGSQLTKPVNLNGYYNARAFFVYGFPLKALKSNLNFNGGVNYNHTPTLINDLLNFSNSYAASGGIFIGSNISQNLDFSLGYNGNYTIVKNTLQTKSDNNFFSHAATFKLNWIIYKGFVLNTDVTHTLYNGLTQSFNQEYFLWNAYVGYKFLNNKSLEAKIYMFDILNQNRSISRTVNGNYTEDNSTVVLKRYLMFTLTYTIRNFKSGAPPKNEEDKNPFPGGRSPGMPPYQGGGH
jgi:hypothetical protein